MGLLDAPGLPLRFPRQADDVWSLYADTVHHTNKGQGLFADALAAFIAPR